MISYSFWPVFSGQYLYPVATLYPSHLCVVHQKNLNHLELWFWNPTTKEKTKVLSSQFIPAGLTLLPNQKGFAFIDQGRIRVKKFDKRSPKAIDIYEPIYHFDIPHFITDDCFLVSAKKGKRFGIFQIDLQGRVQTIVFSEHSDALYPQKIGEQLFYIERIQECSRIISVSYPKVVRTAKVDLDDIDSILAAQDEWEKPLIKKEEKKVLHTQRDKKIIFLKAGASQDLFFVEHAPSVDQEVQLITFSCCRITLFERSWKKLFNFTLPTSFLFHTNPKSLYESILPLLPRYHGEKIYHCSWHTRSDGEGLDIFCYNQETESTTQKTFGKEKQNFFAPTIFHDMLFFGLSCEDNFTFELLQN